MDENSTRPEDVLLKYFGYSAFRPNQLEIVQATLAKQDVLALLPTGGGKSICFQVPGLILGGVTLVISPLISLMKDQVDSLQRKGVSAVYLNSSLEKSVIETHLREMISGKFSFVYVAPERLANPAFLQACLATKITLVAIDEAHCISQWGHDFRPSYLQIKEFLDRLAANVKSAKGLSIRPPVVALTATARGKVCQEIIQSLGLRQPKIFRTSFRRTNLTFSCTTCDGFPEKEVVLFRLLKKYQDACGIIYCSTRDQTTHLAELLKYFHYPGAAYHAGMPAEHRAKVQELFLKGEVPVIAATNAFGMGIDKPDIRFVIHYGLPGNLENYYQEAGRAGRDGKPADCYLLATQSDLKIQLNFLERKITGQVTSGKPKSSLGLEKMVGFINTRDCRTKYILNYFDENVSTQNCHRCDICLEKLARTKRINSIQPDFAKDQELEKFLYKLKKYIAYSKKLQAKNDRVPFLTHKIIQQILLHSPKTSENFLQLPGIGKGWVENWYPVIEKADLCAKY